VSIETLGMGHPKNLGRLLRHNPDRTENLTLLVLLEEQFFVNLKYEVSTARKENPAGS
jgi:hypothetical protein